MKKKLRLKSGQCLLIILPFLYSVLLTGCMMVKGAGPAPRYFGLIAGEENARAGEIVKPGEAVPRVIEKEEGRVSVIIGPVQIPAYLDRPQIVRIARGNRLQVSERNRWAEPLAEAIERVVAMDISRAAHGQFAVRSFSLNTPLEGGDGYRILINIYAFEQRQNGDVILDLLWRLTSVKQNRQILERHENLVAYAKNESFEETVKVMNLLLRRLSEDILAGIEKLFKVNVRDCP